MDIKRKICGRCKKEFRVREGSEYEKEKELCYGCEEEMKEVEKLK
jgi:hypothetical protein